MKQFRHRLFYLSRIAFSRILYRPDKAKLVLLWLLMCLARFQNTQEKSTCMNKEAKSCIYHALELQWSRVKKWPFAVLSIISLSRPVSHLITQVTSAQTRGHYGGALGWPSSWRHEKTYFCSTICLIKKRNNGIIVFVTMVEFHNALHNRQWRHHQNAYRASVARRISCFWSLLSFAYIYCRDALFVW